MKHSDVQYCYINIGFPPYVGVLLGKLCTLGRISIRSNGVSHGQINKSIGSSLHGVCSNMGIVYNIFTYVPTSQYLSMEPIIKQAGNCNICIQSRFLTESPVSELYNICSVKNLMKLNRYRLWLLYEYNEIEISQYVAILLNVAIILGYLRTQNLLNIGQVVGTVIICNTCLCSTTYYTFISKDK